MEEKQASMEKVSMRTFLSELIMVAKNDIFAIHSPRNIKIEGEYTGSRAFTF